MGCITTSFNMRQIDHNTHLSYMTELFDKEGSIEPIELA